MTFGNLPMRCRTTRSRPRHRRRQHVLQVLHVKKAFRSSVGSRNDIILVTASSDSTARWVAAECSIWVTSWCAVLTGGASLRWCHSDRQLCASTKIVNFVVIKSPGSLWGAADFAT